MTAHLSEDEQVEALKNWWKENGKSVIFATVLIVGGYAGWQGWTQHNETQSLAASALFDDLLVATETAADAPLSDTQKTTALTLIEQLTSEYSSNLYAQEAALLAAKLAADDGDFTGAEKHLRWAIDNNVDQGITYIAQLRLASVLSATDKQDEALAVLSAEVPPSFVSAYAELRGDVLVHKGDTNGAREAYQLALNNLTQGQGQKTQWLQTKLGSLAQAYESAPITAPSASSEQNAPAESATEISDSADSQGDAA